MTTTAIPFKAIVEIVQYLHDSNEECRHYCDCLLTPGDGDDHIYKHVLTVLRWLKTTEYADVAGAYLAEAEPQIRQARSEAREAQVETPA
jgi:hypothetical protein